MADTEATVSSRRRIPTIWLVPIVALLLGIWMVIYTIQSQGPEIEIVFSTAAGIEAGKTKIKVRSVEVGIVDSVALRDDLESVEITAELEPAARPLLREDTQFWVVRPRVGPGGVSGLGTLLGGGYIQLSPGTGKEGRREFAGLDEPPVTPAGTPGLHLKLVAERAGSVSTGDPVLYRGFRVGRVETSEFDLEARHMRYGMFIEAPYDGLVSTATRFWDVSGVSVSATAEGLEVDTGSLETLLIGGVALGLPLHVEAGNPVEAGEVYRLYKSYDAVNETPYRENVEFVIEFSESVRGLLPGAPVEYRGIRVGEVERVLIRELVADGLSGSGEAIPVLIRIQPARMELPDTPESGLNLRETLRVAVEEGFRAGLATGNFITGSRYVTLDFYRDEPGETGEFMSWPTIPTTKTGLASLQVRVTALLDKLNALPLEATVANAAETLASINRVVESDEMQALPGSLDATLDELRLTLASLSGESALQAGLQDTLTELNRTLASLRKVMETLSDQPNALIFNRELGDDPRPPAGK